MRLSKAELVTLLHCVKTELYFWNGQKYNLPEIGVISESDHAKSMKHITGRIDSLSHLRSRLNIELQMCTRRNVELRKLRRGK